MEEYVLKFVPSVPDNSAFRELLVDYYEDVLVQVRAIGGPDLSATELADDTLSNIDGILPPDNRLILGWNRQGRLIGCGTLRRIRPDAVEMKRMFVRKEARGQGLGRRLFEMRIDEARRMGCRAVYADTAKGNRPMLEIYERFGFRYVPRYPENANPPEYEPYLVYLEYRFD